LNKQIKKMGLQDMKIYTFNTLALGLSMTNIEVTLRIILLIATIIYTIQKIKSKKQDGDKN
tara:strand:- start:301 stop:483 length:183 start_codon:yes stop_codon:yes gene_type:complete